MLMVLFAFTLYVTGQTPQTAHIINNLRQFCDEHLPNNYVLEIINVLEAPEIAEINNILATPTLIREMPTPCYRIIGDLSNIKKVMALFGLDVHQDA